ncbi:TPA: N-6 DNA methylase, partial [Kluyvera ascorbata]|nr:N-6 DNA methylase [Kluyvera ascorbata]
MVSFLLDNSLGAWWAKKQLTDADLRSASDEKTLRQAAAIEGVPLEYLRFVKTSDEQGELWQAAGGWFDGWPQEVRALKTLDPCCGSGHFLVALFLMLVPMRMQLEGLDARSAVDKVLADNLYGLELDSRCVEIAAFALALEAWRYPNAGGYRALPTLNIACSGLDVSAATQEWLALAKHNPDISEALNWFTRTFNDAPVLGSLIDVNTAYYEGKTEGKASPWQVLLDAKAATDDEAKTAEVTAQGLAVAAKLLSESYHLVATNVPYLARGKQCDMLKDFCENYFPEAKADLATVFLERCIDFTPTGGTSTIVLPQNWLFLTSYKKLREKLLTEYSWDLVARLGPRAFETISGEVVQAILITLTKGTAAQGSLLHGVDVSAAKTAAEKAEQLLVEPLKGVTQAKQLQNPDSIVQLDIQSSELLLGHFASCFQGTSTGDNPRFVRVFWESSVIAESWKLMESVSHESQHYGGKNSVINWTAVVEFTGSATRGWDVFDNTGVAIGQLAQLPATIYLGQRFPNTTPVIVTKNKDSLPAVWALCMSDSFSFELRKINQKLSVDNGYVAKIPFDLAHWTRVANEQYPIGLPKPYTNDPTQWIFHGHPCG